MLIALIGTLLLTTCTSHPTKPGGRAARSTPTLAPDANFPVVNDGHSAFDQLVKNAIDDVQNFWRGAYPTISGGKAYPELKGKVYSVDGSHLTAAVRQNACLQQEPASIVDNAFYCRADDSVAYDRSDQHLVPTLGRKYGSFIVAAVIAHEWGHAIQQRLGIFDQNLPTIVTESQADCAAGAFIRTVQDQRARHFLLTQQQLDQTLLGYLQVRDPPPVTTSQISHGNGFDRLSAMADGIGSGAAFCFGADYVNRRFTERPFTTEADYLNQGNVAFQKVITPGPPSARSSGLQADLNRFFSGAASSIHKTWQAVDTGRAAHPPCAVQLPTQFGYCASQNTVYFNEPFARQAYYSLPDHSINRSTGAVTLTDNAPADYALGTLFVYGWGLSARHQLLNAATTGGDSVIAASCYAGAYSADINTENPPGGFALSPPDMDEATEAILRLVPLDQAYGAQGTTGLQRIQAFTKGYFGGLLVC
ncbi:MAG: putative metalloprotease [Frankiales bacterium]|nr:putative metalloprotease [Frankiales bacterium]